MENKDEKQVNTKFLRLMDHLSQGTSLDRSAEKSGLSLKEAINYLKQKKAIKTVEPEILSEISHNALEVGLKSLMEICETCMIPQVRAMASVELVKIGVKLKEMQMNTETGLTVEVRGSEEESPWKFVK